MEDSMGMLHQPDGTIQERLQEAEQSHGEVIRKLIVYGWSNKSISAYIGMDEWTIKRFRRINSGNAECY